MMRSSLGTSLAPATAGNPSTKRLSRLQQVSHVCDGGGAGAAVFTQHDMHENKKETTHEEDGIRRAARRGQCPRQ